MNRRRPLALGCGVVLSALLLSLSPVAAKSGVCRQLEAELARASTGGPSAKVRKYDKAIAAQRNELAKARSRGGNCGLSLFGLGQCGGRDATIGKMERNLAALERERAGLRGGASRRERNRIAAALDANGCRDSEMTERRLPQPVAVDRRNAELLHQALGELNQAEPLPDDDTEENGERNVRHVLNPSIGLRFEGMYGSFRTLCVRTCDGYFFPVSNQSTRADFDRDRKNCEATCPGAEVELFYQRTDAAESDEIISAATGAPYSQLSNAYLYKDVAVPRPAMCGCAARPKNFSVIAGKTSQDRPPPGGSPRPEPTGSLVSGVGPETHASVGGGQPAGTVTEMPPPKPALPPPPPSGQRKVRVVGPAFLPDRSEAIDLRAPARTAVR